MRTKRPGAAPRAWPGIPLLRPGAAREAEARAALTGCVRACADRLAELTGPSTGPGGRPDAGRTRLVAALGALIAAHTVRGAAAGRSSGPVVDKESFDALLRAGDAALDAAGCPAGETAGHPAADARDLRLALLLADAALTVRRNSRAAWLLRARALEGMGRGAEAAEAYERHLALSEPGPGTRAAAARLAALTERRECLAGALRLFPADDCPEARAFAEAAGGGLPASEVRAAFTAYMDHRLRERGAADPAVRDLAALYAAYCRLAERDRMPDPLLGGGSGRGEGGGDGEPLAVGDLRNAVAGRTVCLVANTPRLADHVPDAGIDAYDLVVRCDAFPLDVPGAGERTDIHALSHRTTARLDHRVGIRLVFGDPAEEWLRAVRRLVPGAQRRVGDASLRHPVTDPALIGESAADPGPTTAFTMLRLLDFLGVCQAVDLIGFDLPGPGRLRPAERAWAEARAEDSTTTRISLR
ncbi:hypothetical protein [Streptomyces radiopugnans]|uniref:Glycosyltransferase family 29 (Sialyltransferase) n=1 Tax=Streptomyces radiopugnans TaxID=403935 RepID=A0A1H9H4V0_9ACTN|nr:hypothetical protein [Streptomyces radiopugnans]SEQ57319.1 hypothetical protein SAMN05216481_110107 [Streptomyces radiopugnans]